MISGTGDAQRGLTQRENEREKEREIERRNLAQSIVREIAIDANGASRDRAVDRDLAERRATLREIANGASLTVDLANDASAPSISRTVLRRRRSRRFFWVL